jgi:hypothetical protein
MTKTISIFDNQEKPKYGAKFNGSIEDTDTYETIGYLDFLHPDTYFKKLNDTEKPQAFELVTAALKNDYPAYLSFVKDPNRKMPLANALGILEDRGQGVFTVNVKLDGEFGDEVWLQQQGAGKNRYVGFDNSKPQNNIGIKIAV